MNQSLTGLLLRLEAVREAAPPELEAELAETKALANQAMRELLSLARQLRPTALDDLGLAAAIAGQVEQVSRAGARGRARRGGRLLRPRQRRAARRLPGRPGGALQRGAALGRRADRGGPAPLRRRESSSRSPTTAAASPSRSPSSGLGIAGMRERALLVGGELTIESRPGQGTHREAARYEGADRRRPRDRPLRDAAAARAPARHRGDRRGGRRRRGARAGGPRAPRPGDPRRQDAEADRAAGDPRDQARRRRRSRS